MKALLLSITAGQGHHATAKALNDCFQEMGVETTTIDTYEYASQSLKTFIDKGYLLSTAKVPKAYGKGYDLVASRKGSPSEHSLTALFNKIISHELADCVRELNPDIVVCTHPFAAAVANILKKQGHIRGIVAGVVTDFTVHPIWEETIGIDYYITASELLALQLKKKNIDTNKMLPFGIPIHPKFSKKHSRKWAAAQLGIDPDKKTILIMSGSMGFGKMNESVDLLDDLDMDFQALVVCGNNKAVKNKIEKKQYRHDFYVFGYVNNVDVMMDASDCIITKPGGITTSESLAKGIPMIMINPIPGQEARNVEFLLNNQLGILVTKTFPIDEAVMTLFNDERHLPLLEKNIALHAKKNSSQSCCEFLVARAKERNDTIKVYEQ